MANHPRSPQGEGAFQRERIAPEHRADDASVAELMGGLVSDAQHLVRREIDLAKREVAIELGKVRQSAVALGIGAGVLVIGALLLAHMLVYLLQAATDLSLWVSYLIVGGIFAAAGGLLLVQGLNRLKQVDPVPRETIESVRKDVEWIKEQNPSDKI
jgi:hypothetical protein